MEFLKFGFVASPHDERRPIGLLCTQILANESVKPIKLSSHLMEYHSDHVSKDVEFFRSLKAAFVSSCTVGEASATSSRRDDDGSRATHELSLLIAKTGKPHTIRESCSSRQCMFS